MVTFKVQTVEATSMKTRILLDLVEIGAVAIEGFLPAEVQTLRRFLRKYAIADYADTCFIRLSEITDNEWPTAANLRKRYWLYVVLDCATQPRLYRVQDPIRLAFSTRQSFVLNAGDIIREAEYD